MLVCTGELASTDSGGVIVTPHTIPSAEDRQPFLDAGWVGDGFSMLLDLEGAGDQHQIDSMRLQQGQLVVFVAEQRDRTAKLLLLFHELDDQRLGQTIDSLRARGVASTNRLFFQSSDAPTVQQTVSIGPHLSQDVSQLDSGMTAYHTFAIHPRLGDVGDGDCHTGPLLLPVESALVDSVVGEVSSWNPDIATWAPNGSMYATATFQGGRIVALEADRDKTEAAHARSVELDSLLAEPMDRRLRLADDQP